MRARSFAVSGYLLLGLSSSLAIADGLKPTESLTYGIHTDIPELKHSGQFLLPKNDNKSVFKGGHLDSALVLGTVAEADLEGKYYKTMEAQIMVGDAGAIDKDAGFESLKEKLSTRSENLYYQLRQLDPKQPFIIKYKRMFMKNPFTRATRYKIVDIYPTYTGQDPRNAGIPSMYIETQNTTNGHLPAQLSGRILKVQRKNTISKRGCVVTIQLPGLKTVKEGKHHLDPKIGIGIGFASAGKNGGGLGFVPEGFKPELGLNYKYSTKEKKILNTSEMSIKSEEGCSYAESLIPFAHPVDVVYSQKFTEIFSHSRVVKSISLKETVSDDSEVSKN